MVSKKAAQAALDKMAEPMGNLPHIATLQALIDAMPDDPESREEMLGRVCYEVIATESDCTYSPWAQLQSKPAWIAAAAAVAEKCQPREVTADLLKSWGIVGVLYATDRINRYVRGEE